MHTTVAQNAAHRADSEWIKSKGKTFNVNGETFVSEYVNAFTGWSIRKSWRMTGRDWLIFDADNNEIARAHSLTFAKYDAAEHYTKEND